MLVGGQLGAAPMSDCVAPGNRTGGRGPYGEAPTRCTGEGEAAGVRPREPSTDVASPSSIAGKEERWREREMTAAARSQGGGGRGARVGRRARPRKAQAASPEWGIDIMFL